MPSHPFLSNPPATPRPRALTLAGRARALVRVPVLIAWTGLLMGVCALSLAVGLLFPAAITGMRRHVPRLWARGVSRIASIDIAVEGDVPRGRALWVSNHLGYLDPVIFLAIRPLYFLAKSEVRGWPGIGAAGRMIGTLFIDRARKRDLLRVIPEMQGLLEAGETVLFFPEGTSTHGGLLLPFRSSLFEAAARSGAEVQCVSLQFRTADGDPPAWESVCWWGDMTFADHAFRLLALRRIDARVRIAPKPVPWSENRKAVSRAAERETEAHFVPVPGAPGSADDRTNR